MSIEITIGQTLWYVPRYNYQPYEVTVTGIGRKWIQASHHGLKMRIDKETLEAHENDGNGKCYLNKEDFAAKDGLQKAFSAFRSDVSRLNKVPVGVSVEDIQEARRLLRMDGIHV